ncbi:hypothetical protein [Streptomyces sp. NPDC005760]|uniref:hypothetical protein n=1 Tax=Streptomyces sp. NPDC005760 TaxID=3156718 RepID=UPI0033FDCA31
MSEQRHGAWWAPESPTERVSGSLTGVGGAWRLTLVGGFQVDRGGDGLHLVPPTTINKPGTTESTNDQWVTTWRVGSLVRGGHVRDTTRFSSAFFEITGLPAWWPLSGLRGPQVRPGPYVAPEDVVASALAGALRLTEAVITLRLVTEAGLPSGADLLARLDRHRGLRSLSKQTVADWDALAHRISPQQWALPDPGPQLAIGNADAMEQGTDPTTPVRPA